MELLMSGESQTRKPMQHGFKTSNKPGWRCPVGEEHEALRRDVLRQLVVRRRPQLLDRNAGERLRAQ